MSHQWMILAIVPCMLATTSPAQAATPFSRQVPANASGDVRVSNVSGDITLTAWDKPAVDVQAEIGSGVERIDVDEEGGDVQVRVILKDRSWLERNGWRDSAVRLQIKVPARADLDASSVSGTVTVHGSLGEQRLKSVSGDIRADVAGTEVSATTVSGNVDLSGSGRQTHVRATSVSGNVRLRRLGGDIEARSTSGSIDIDAASATEIHANVVSGNLAILGTLARDAELDLAAVSGRIKVAAQAPDGFRYDVSTSSGNVRHCFGADTESDGYRQSWKPGKRLAGTRGEGKATIRARSHSGNVDICDR